MKYIRLGQDFSETPLGRYPEDSPVSGARFREEFLLPALKKDGEVTVRIDDAEGYGSSFLDEAFGGLVREGHFSPDELRTKLTIACDDPDYSLYRDLIWKYIDDAHRLARV